MEAFNTQATMLMGGPLPKNFNEVLTCCYLPKTGMNFHADDEPGLGPVVASLSLGSAALMSFRRKLPKKETKANPQNTTPGWHQKVIVQQKDPKTAPIVLKLLIKHGDIVLQVGSQIQKNWLHAVATEGFRIAATARNICPELMETPPATNQKESREFSR
ncbi:hypothetical protein CROQUDRAFT_48392 [Cronartium quercuum f. sp. fusiforme G11]|uniref:Alpha-ketoglutarate-dependent dioxygenase AlkB-like domain-containing protein n=1 Tax=Cronartium quercuum f. sp. fusiforme G11 TaxID=708437 RepID=A0A9P6NGL4_9BASI|nr:hypothetical protein CROQUDRAFT_48392 [Cronartium quercuum f. sp. fusiforme G11]